MGRNKTEGEKNYEGVGEKIFGKEKIIGMAGE